MHQRRWMEVCEGHLTVQIEFSDITRRWSWR